MQPAIAASLAATFQGCPTWVKNTARATFVLCFIKSAVWVCASWLAMRGFGGL